MYHGAIQHGKGRTYIGLLCTFGTIVGIPTRTMHGKYHDMCVPCRRRQGWNDEGTATTMYRVAVPLCHQYWRRRG